MKTGSMWAGDKFRPSWSMSLTRQENFRMVSLHLNFKALQQEERTVASVNLCMDMAFEKYL